MRDGETATARRRASRRHAKRSPPSTRGARWPITADRVLITAGHVRRDRPGAERARRRRRRGARADADLSALHGGARETRRARAFLPDRSRERMGARFRTISSTRSRRRRARSSSSIPTIRPARPIRATARRQLIEFAERHGLVILADEVYGDLGYDGPVAADRQPRSGRAGPVVLEPVEGLCRAGLAHRLGGGRPIAAARQRARAR